jgi:hypothetical protein
MFVPICANFISAKIVPICVYFISAKNCAYFISAKIVPILFLQKTILPNENTTLSRTSTYLWLIHYYLYI